MIVVNNLSGAPYHCKTCLYIVFVYVYSVKKQKTKKNKKKTNVTLHIITRNGINTQKMIFLASTNFQSVNSLFLHYAW